MARPRGFTIIELTITIVVAGLILSIVGRALGDAQRRIAGDQAMKTFEAMHARARAHAIERGATATLVLDADADSASVVVGGEIVESVHFRPELGVDVWTNSGTNPLEVCMTSRGYGEASCMSFNATVQVSFGSGRDTSTIQILPLGQLKR